jgi:hypothetical protein
MGIYLLEYSGLKRKVGRPGSMNIRPDVDAVYNGPGPMPYFTV